MTSRVAAWRCGSPAHNRDFLPHIGSEINRRTIWQVVNTFLIDKLQLVMRILSQAACNSNLIVRHLGLGIVWGWILVTDLSENCRRGDHEHHWNKKAASHDGPLKLVAQRQISAAPQCQRVLKSMEKKSEEELSRVSVARHRALRDSSPTNGVHAPLLGATWEMMRRSMSDYFLAKPPWNTHETARVSCTHPQSERAPHY